MIQINRTNLLKYIPYQRYFYWLLILLFVSCENSIRESKDTENQTIETKKSANEYSYHVLEYSPANWGYQLFQSGNLLIEQKHIPAIQGIRGFSSKQKAETTANYVLQKIKNGEFPPTLSPEELESLGVLD